MNSTTNRIWSSLRNTPGGLFGDACDLVALKAGTTLTVAGQPTSHIHLVEAGLLSVMSEGENVDVEIGMIGCEGLSGFWVALGRSASPFRVVVQSDLVATTIPADIFRAAFDQRPDLRAIVLDYACEFTTMVAETCRVATRFSIEARLARWLLMAYDRLGEDKIVITHEALSRTLGVRRPGVTVATHVLEGEGMIRATRGTIRVINREKLRVAARQPGKIVDLRPRGHDGALLSP